MRGGRGRGTTHRGRPYSDKITLPHGGVPSGVLTVNPIWNLEPAESGKCAYKLKGCSPSQLLEAGQAAAVTLLAPVGVQQAAAPEAAEEPAAAGLAKRRKVGGQDTAAAAASGAFSAQQLRATPPVLTWGWGCGWGSG